MADSERQYRVLREHTLSRDELTRDELVDQIRSSAGQLSRLASEFMDEDLDDRVDFANDIRGIAEELAEDVTALRDRRWARGR